MHAKPGLRVLLEWKIACPGSVIVTVMPEERLRMTFKPDGYTSVAPYLTVNGAKGTIDFLVRVFGAERLRVLKSMLIAGGPVTASDYEVPGSASGEKATCWNFFGYMFFLWGSGERTTVRLVFSVDDRFKDG